MIKYVCMCMYEKLKLTNISSGAMVTVSVVMPGRDIPGSQNRHQTGNFGNLTKIGHFGKKASMPRYEPGSLERQRPYMALGHLSPHV
uniref:Ovule protein n=1 Tax=Haemonchus contortus TaxID=6289 RepID=A0A7I4YFL6_HAECO